MQKKRDEQRKERKSISTSPCLSQEGGKLLCTGGCNVQSVSPNRKICSPIFSCLSPRILSFLIHVKHLHTSAATSFNVRLQLDVVESY